LFIYSLSYRKRTYKQSCRFETEVLLLKKNSTFSILLSVISAVAAIATAVVAVTLYFEKKRKDEEELEQYLNNSIQ